MAKHVSSETGLGAGEPVGAAGSRSDAKPKIRLDLIFNIGMPSGISSMWKTSKA